jgi:2'-5' RNA ligase
VWRVVAALELYFDHQATRRIRGLWEALEGEGVQSLASLPGQLHRPHLSLVVADRLDPDVVSDALSDLTAAPPLVLDFQYAAQFVGRVLWLGPAPSTALLTHHAAVHERLARAGVRVWDQYHPDQWVPHCTLSMRVANPVMGAAIRRCLEILPLTATVVSAAVADHARGIAHPLSP